MPFRPYDFFPGLGGERVIHVRVESPQHRDSNRIRVLLLPNAQRHLLFTNIRKGRGKLIYHGLMSLHITFV